MRIYKEKYKDRDGNECQKKRWYIDFSDHLNRRHKLAGFVQKKPTEELSRQIETLISCRVSGQTLPVELQRWIEGLPDTMIKNLVKWGLLEGQRANAGKPLSEHVQDWKQDLIAKGKTSNYAETQHYRVSGIFNQSGFQFFSEVSASKLQQEISKLKTTVKARNDKGKLYDKVTGEASQTTKNYYLKACKQFCRWMVKDGRVSKNPLKHLTPSKAQSKKRAAFEPDELRELLTHTEAAGTSFGLEGYQRAMLYRFASETGFRASEIKALKVSDFDFKAGYVRLDGKHTKNGKGATIPLKPSTAEKLKTFFIGKLPQTQAFKLPCKTNMARMLRKDIEAAGIEIEAERGIVDFHCLRHTFGTMLAASGVHPKAAQQLMRHSDINLTMSRYTHILRGQEAAAVASLPDLDTLPESQQLKMTGTDNKTVDAKGKICADICADKNGAGDSKTLHLFAKSGGTSGKSQNSVIEGKNADFEPKTGIFTNTPGRIRTCDLRIACTLLSIHKPCGRRVISDSHGK
jgi:integrase